MTRPPKKAPAPRSGELPRAARDGDAAEVVRLLDAGVPVDALDRDARTALDLAAQKNHADVVRVLLAAGADPAAHAGPYHDLERYGRVVGALRYARTRAAAAAPADAGRAAE